MVGSMMDAEIHDLFVSNHERVAQCLLREVTVHVVVGRHLESTKRKL